MGEKSIYLLGILLTILVGTYFHWKHCCGHTLPAQMEDIEDTSSISAFKVAQKVPLSLNEYSVCDFLFLSLGSFNFGASDSTLKTPVSEELQIGMVTLRRYLVHNASSEKNIEIVVEGAQKL